MARERDPRRGLRWAQCDALPVSADAQIDGRGSHHREGDLVRRGRGIVSERRGDARRARRERRCTVKGRRRLLGRLRRIGHRPRGSCGKNGDVRVDEKLVDDGRTGKRRREHTRRRPGVQREDHRSVREHGDRDGRRNPSPAHRRTVAPAPDTSMTTFCTADRFSRVSEEGDWTR